MHISYPQNILVRESIPIARLIYWVLSESVCLSHDHHMMCLYISFNHLTDWDCEERCTEQGPAVATCPATGNPIHELNLLSVTFGVYPSVYNIHSYSSMTRTSKLKARTRIYTTCSNRYGAKCCSMWLKYCFNFSYCMLVWFGSSCTFCCYYYSWNMSVPHVYVYCKHANVCRI